MEITVMGIKAEIESIYPELPNYWNHDSTNFSVWLKLKDPLPGTGTVGFGVSIPATEYSKESFTETVIKAAEIRAEAIIKDTLTTKKALDDTNSEKSRLQRMIDELKKKLK